MGNSDGSREPNPRRTGGRPGAEEQPPDRTPARDGGRPARASSAAPDTGRDGRRSSGAAEEWSAGGVVIRPGTGEHRVLLIRDPYGKWGLPKGHVEDGEAPADAALREVREETGLEDLELGPFVMTIDWFFRFQGRVVHKHCDFFLMASRNGDPRPEKEEGIRECRWVSVAQAPDRVSYDNASEVVSRAGRVLLAPSEAFPPWRR